LYVYVEAAGPTVEVSGDTEPRVDEPATYNASARAGDADLESLTWKLGNRTVARAGLSGSTDSAHREFGFTDSGPYRLVVVVRDGSNRTARDVLTIEPQDSSGGSGDGSGGFGSASTELSAAGEGGGTERGCEEAAVFRNPTGSGTAAAVTCADANSAIVDRYADETCSSDISDCEYADPDGLRGSEYSQLDDGNGDGYSGGDIAYQSRNPGNSSGTTDGGRNGGDEYIGAI
jgi:hypothetical protein